MISSGRRDTSSRSALREMVNRAAAVVAGCAGATSSLWRDGTPVRQVSSHPDLSALLACERDLRDCPTRAAVAAFAPVVIDDLVYDVRWPEVSTIGLRVGVRCQTTVVTTYGASLVTFTVYGLLPKGLSLHSAELALALADEGLATVDTLIAYDGAQREAQHLEAAFATRDVIEQAKGMIMHRKRCSAEEAFDELVRTSQHGQLKIADVARVLVTRYSATPRAADGAAQVAGPALMHPARSG